MVGWYYDVAGSVPSVLAQGCFWGGQDGSAGVSGGAGRKMEWDMGFVFGTTSLLLVTDGGNR